MVVVQKVAPYFVARTWPLVERYFAAAAEHSHGEWTVEQARADIHTGRWGLITVTDGEVVGAISYIYQNNRNSRTALITAIAGIGMATNDGWEQLKAIFIADGATEAEGAVRPSVLRLWSKFGFKEKHTIARVAL
jgi:hypothetical protein